MATAKRIIEEEIAKNEQQELPSSPPIRTRRERMADAVENLTKARHDMVVLADHFNGIRESPEDRRAVEILAHMAEGVLVHLRAVQRRMGERG